MEDPVVVDVDLSGVDVEDLIAELAKRIRLERYDHFNPPIPTELLKGLLKLSGIPAVIRDAFEQWSNSKIVGEKELQSGSNQWG